MEEKTAIARMKRGDISGLAVLVEHYQTKAVRAAYMIVRDRTTAEDIVQATFVRIYHHIDQFDTNRRFEPWFMRSVANAALQHERKANRQLSLDAPLEPGADDLTLSDMLQTGDPDPSQAVESDEQREAIWQALEKLSADQRAAIVMRYYLDLSEQEMADALDTPPGTIKWRLHAARKRLAGLLQIDRTRSRASND